MGVLPVGFKVSPEEGGKPEDTAWVIFFIDDAVSVEVQCSRMGDGV